MGRAIFEARPLRSDRTGSPRVPHGGSRGWSKMGLTSPSLLRWVLTRFDHVPGLVALWARPTEGNFEVRFVEVLVSRFFFGTSEKFGNWSKACKEKKIGNWNSKNWAPSTKLWLEESLFTLSCPQPKHPGGSESVWIQDGSNDNEPNVGRLKWFSHWYDISLGVCLGKTRQHTIFYCESCHSLIDWLGWLVDWLVDWLIVWLIDWLIDCLIDWYTAIGANYGGSIVCVKAQANCHTVGVITQFIFARDPNHK